MRNCQRSERDAVFEPSPELVGSQFLTNTTPNTTHISAESPTHSQRNGGRCRHHQHTRSDSSSSGAAVCSLNISPAAATRGSKGARLPHVRPCWTDSSGDRRHQGACCVSYSSVCRSDDRAASALHPLLSVSHWPFNVSLMSPPPHHHTTMPQCRALGSQLSRSCVRWAPR